MSLEYLESNSTLILLSFDLIVIDVVLLLIVSSGSFSALGDSFGLLNSETLPSLSITILFPFSERPSTLSVKGLRASATGASLGTEYSYFVPYSFSLTLFPFYATTVFLIFGCIMN